MLRDVCAPSLSFGSQANPRMLYFLAGTVANDNRYREVRVITDFGVQVDENLNLLLVPFPGKIDAYQDEDEYAAEHNRDHDKKKIHESTERTSRGLSNPRQRVLVRHPWTIARISAGRRSACDDVHAPCLNAAPLKFLLIG